MGQAQGPPSAEPSGQGGNLTNGAGPGVPTAPGPVLGCEGAGHLRWVRGRMRPASVLGAVPESGQVRGAVSGEGAWNLTQATGQMEGSQVGTHRLSHAGKLFTGWLLPGWWGRVCLRNNTAFLEGPRRTLSLGS